MLPSPVMVSSDELSSSVRSVPTPWLASMRVAKHSISLLPPRPTRSSTLASRMMVPSVLPSSRLSIVPLAIARPSDPSRRAGYRMRRGAGAVQVGIDLQLAGREPGLAHRGKQRLKRDARRMQSQRDRWRGLPGVGGE